MEERGLSLLFQEYPPLILLQRHSYVDFGCLKDDIACLKVRAQFLFSLRFRAQIFFHLSFQGSIGIFFADFEGSIYFHHSQGHRVSKSVCHWRTGASRQKRKGCRCFEMHNQPYLRPK